MPVETKTVLKSRIATDITNSSAARSITRTDVGVTLDNMVDSYDQTGSAATVQANLDAHIDTNPSTAGRQVSAHTFEIVSDTPDVGGEILHATGNDLTGLTICLDNSDIVSSAVHVIVIHEELGGSIQTDKVGEFIVTSHTASAVGLDYTRIVYTGYLSDETKAAFGLGGFSFGSVGNDVRLVFLVPEHVTAFVPSTGTANTPLGYGSDGSFGEISIVPGNISSATKQEDRVVSFDDSGDFDVTRLVGADILYLSLIHISEPTRPY